MGTGRKGLAHAVGTLLVFAAAGGCVSYETESGGTNVEIKRDSARTRALRSGPVGEGAVTIRVTETWQREQRETTEVTGGFEVESLLASFSEEPEMFVLSPLWLAIDVVTLVISTPLALIDSATSGDVVVDRTVDMTEPVLGEHASVSSGSWRTVATTEQGGSATIVLREPAASALCAGRPLSYRIDVPGCESLQVELSLEDTLACADLPRATEPADRHQYWQGLLARCESESSRALLAKRAARADPATLRRFRAQRKLPASMSLLHVDHFRSHAESSERARAAQDYATSSEQLQAMAALVAKHDAAMAGGLEKQSVADAARYVVHYYAQRSLRSTPSFLVEYCNRQAAQARRLRDDRSTAIFSAVLAARASDVRRLECTERAKTDRVVADLHERAAKEIRRQAAQRAYAAEVARIKEQEEAWHYRYLNGSGGRGYGAVGSTRSGATSSYRGTSGPSVADQARAHQEWLQTQKYNAANRNRAFDQFDRRN